MVIISLALIILLPILFIYALTLLETYHTVRLPVLMIAVGWGVISFFLSGIVENTAIAATSIDYPTLTMLIAPIVEESFKSVAIIVMYVFVLVRYTGDAMIYGAGVGTGFAIAENIRYILLASDTALGIALTRIVSTGLLHIGIAAVVATAASVVVYYNRRHALWTAMVLVVSAMIVHGLYNAALWLEDDSIIVITSVFIGMVMLIAMLFLLNFNVRHETNQIIHELRHDPSQFLLHTVQHEGKEINVLDYVHQVYGHDQMVLVHDYLLTQGQLAVYTEHLDNGDHREAAIRALNREIAHHKRQVLQILDKMEIVTQDWLLQIMIDEVLPDRDPA